MIAPWNYRKEKIENEDKNNVTICTFDAVIPKTLLESSECQLSPLYY